MLTAPGRRDRRLAVVADGTLYLFDVTLKDGAKALGEYKASSPILSGALVFLPVLVPSTRTHTHTLMREGEQCHGRRKGPRARSWCLGAPTGRW